MYQVDPNDNLKMIPKNKIVKDAYGRATTPAAETIQPRPSHILVNMNGTYAFAYESGSSDTYVTGSVVDDAAGPIRLEIQPVAWRQTNAAGAVGDVTFVYIGD
tara:strand:+ start:28 stop:336 length:309 start_codon:yes stop_codon:yes gene_type:complete